LVAAEPAAGATLSASPPEIRLTFNEPVTADSQIIIYGEGFQPLPGLTAQLEPTNPAEVYAAVPELAPGDYTVQWAAVSADGHEISGSYSFSVDAPSTVTGQAFPWWQAAGIGSLVLIAAAILRRYWRPQGQAQRGKRAIGG
jgi:methionine-rich copper-binding protein CopC